MHMRMNFSTLFRSAVRAGYSAEAAQFFARATAVTATADKDRYATLIDALVAAGVWSKLDVLHVYAAPDSVSARVNLVKAGHTASAFNGPVFVAGRGFEGNGLSAHLRTGFTPSTQGVNFTRNSAHAMAWNLRNRTGALPPIIGATDNSTREVSIYPYYTNGKAYARVNNASDAGIDGVKSDGCFIANRTGSNARQLYFDGTEAFGDYVDSASTDPVALNVYVLAMNSAGSAAFYASDEVAAVSFGGGLTSTEVADYDAALRAYLTSTGALS